MRDHAIDVVMKPAWVGHAADAVGDAVKHAYAAGGVRGLRTKSALNGVWLGHPLHPALTDVPLGAWTAAVAFDAASVVTKREDLAGCASAAIAVGLTGAVAAAASGVTDWSDTDGQSRRAGFVHGVLNLSATALFATSLVMRQRGPSAGGRLCALLGYVVALGAAYVGGDLVYGRQIGVNHAAGQDVPEDFTPVFAASELKEHQMKRITVGTTGVLLVRRGDAVHAIADTCSHLGGPLSEGTLKDGAVVCPWHGSCFTLADGHVVNGPATHPQPSFETRVHNGQIEIRMPRREQPAARTGGGNAITQWHAAS